MSRLVLEHLTKDFPGLRKETIRAVSGLSLSVEEGELLVLMGPSGCGKTTTLRLIAGLEEPTEGRIWLDGQLLNGVLPKHRDIAMVFQNPALYPHLSAYDNLAFGLKLRKVPRSELEKRVWTAAEMLGLTECLARRPQELSGGQRQRVALGRAMVRQPKLLLMDEPLSNLDTPLRVQLRAELAHLHKQLAATIIYVTHDQKEAMVLGQRVAVMNHGSILQAADPLTLRDSPANRFVADFIAAGD